MTDLVSPFLTELRRGTLTLAVLSQLKQPQYGYSLVQALEESSISIDQSTLYPLLRRMEKQQLVSSTWDTTESRPRKYYVLTDLGHQILGELYAEWKQMSTNLQQLLEGGTSS